MEEGETIFSPGLSNSYENNKKIIRILSPLFFMNNKNLLKQAILCYVPMKNISRVYQQINLAKIICGLAYHRVADKKDRYTRKSLVQIVAERRNSPKYTLRQGREEEIIKKDQVSAESYYLQAYKFLKPFYRMISAGKKRDLARDIFTPFVQITPANVRVFQEELNEIFESIVWAYEDARNKISERKTQRGGGFSRR